jgi:hypothetical protein
MSVKSQTQPMATAAAAPGLFTQVGMAGGAAVVTVSFIHPIDVVKVCQLQIEKKANAFYGTALQCLKGRSIIVGNHAADSPFRHSTGDSFHF